MSCGGIKRYEHRDCLICQKVVPTQTCPFCEGPMACMVCYDCPDCNLRRGVTARPGTDPACRNGHSHGRNGQARGRQGCQEQGCVCCADRP